MSQERSQVAPVAASLFLAGFAYFGGIVAMGLMQSALARKVELRWIMVLAEGALAFPALIVAWLLWERIPEIVVFRPLSRFAPVLLVFLGFALWILSLGVLQAQYAIAPPPQAYLDQFQGLLESLRPRRPIGWVFSLGAIAVAPAVFEEVVFRGVLTPVLNRAAGPAVAVLVSGVLFGAIHIDLLADGTSVYYRVPFAILLGMLLAKLRLDTGSLWPSMVAHATLNATTFLLVALVATETPATVQEANPLVAAAMLLVGMPAALWIISVLKRGGALRAESVLAHQ